MKQLSIIVCAGVLLFGTAACSNSDVDQEAEAGATGEGTAEIGAPADNPAIGATLNQVSADVEAQKYDAAIQKLAEMKEIPKSPEDERAYRQQVFKTQQQLLQRAQSDPRAQESYQQLGRAITGR